MLSLLFLEEVNVATRETRKKNDTDNGSTQSLTKSWRASSPVPDLPPKSWFRRWGIYALLGVIILLATLISDGLRREKLEFTATVSLVNGNGEIVSKDGKKTNLTVGAVLNVSDTVVTGPLSSAIITLHDGSAVRIDHDSSLQIRMLDYTRNGIRQHTYLVNEGGIISRVSQFFGVDSQQRTSSPTAVAAARGTGYQFKYKRIGDETTLQTIQHSVHFSYKGQKKDCSAGFQLSSSENSIIGPIPIEQSVFQDLQNKFHVLVKYERAPGWLERFERRLIKFINPILQSTGNGPDGLSDTERVQMCRNGLQKLRDLIDRSGGKPPTSLNHMTLSELGADEATCSEILSAFMGGNLIDYKLTENGEYTISAHSRDSLHTLITITGQTNANAESSVPKHTTKKQADATKKVASAGSKNDQGQAPFPTEVNPIPGNFIPNGIGRGVLLSSNSANWMSPLTALIAPGALPVSLDAGEVMRVMGSFEEITGPEISPPVELPAPVGSSASVPSGIQITPEPPVVVASIIDGVTNVPVGTGMGSGGLSALAQSLGPALLTALLVTDNKTSSSDPDVVPEPSSILTLACGGIGLYGFIKQRRRQ